MKMKSWWLAVCLLVVFGIVSTANADNVALRYTYVKYCTADLQVSGGVDDVTGSISSYDERKTSINVRLQKRSSGGSWSTICIWTDINSNGESVAGGTQNVAKGYDYRVYTVGKVYDSSGSVIETVDKYSPVVSY